MDRKLILSILLWWKNHKDDGFCVTDGMLGEGHYCKTYAKEPHFVKLAKKIKKGVVKMSITIKVIREYQDRLSKLKTIGEFKVLGRELRDKYNLADMEAIDILNNKPEKILAILEKYEKENER